MKPSRKRLKQLEAEQKQLREAEEDTLSLSSYCSEASSFYSDDDYSDDDYSDDDYSDDDIDGPYRWVVHR